MAPEEAGKEKPEGPPKEPREPAQTPQTAQPEPKPQPAQFPSFDEGAARAGADNLDLLMDVSLKMRVELGRTRMLVEDVLKLVEGSVIELDKLAGDPVDILVNDRPVAKGEVLVVDDNFCIRITEILSPKERLMRPEE